MATPADYLAISNAMYVKFGETPIAPVGWSLEPGSITRDATRGTMAAVFKNNSANEYVVGVEGTNLNSGNATFSNAQMSANKLIAAGGRPAIYDDVAEIIAATKLAYPNAVVNATGHSLAGGAVQYGAVQNNTGGASFGGPGIPNYTDDGSHGNFKSYVNYGDILGAFVPRNGSHVGEKIPLGNPMDVYWEVAAGPWWGTYLALSNHSLTRYAVNILGPDTPTPTPLNVQRLLDDPFGTFGADATSQFTILSDGTLLTTYKAPDGTLLGNATQNVDGTGSVSLFATSGQSWIKETGFFNAKGQLASAETQKANGDLERTSFGAANNESYYARTFIEDLNGALKTQRDVLAAGDQIIRDFDARNARLWEDRVFGMDPTGNVTAVQVRLNGETTTRSAANPVDYSAIGQIFGSAIGRAIAGNDNQFKTLAVGTVAGFVGQKFVQALINGPGAIDLAQLDIAGFFNGKDVSLAGAGLGAAPSFLAAELATSIGLSGVGEQMFASAVGGYLGSVLNQVRQQGFNVLTAVVDWNVALHASEVNIASTIGSLLAHEFVHPESQYGAVGGQLAGAVGSALAYSFSLALGPILNVFLPGVGAFFGTIIGTIIGDAFAGDPAYPKAFHDVRILGSDQHFTNRLVGTDDQGNAEVSEAMGDQVAKIANSYLDTVHGAGIYYSGKVMIGYNAGAGPHQYITGWFPNGTEEAPHFATATDAIQQGVRELLRNTEVFGGDLLIKRAHQAFISGVPPDRTRRGKARGVIRAGGWRRVPRASASMARILKGFA